MVSEPMPAASLVAAAVDDGDDAAGGKRKKKAKKDEGPVPTLATPAASGAKKGGFDALKALRNDWRRKWDARRSRRGRGLRKRKNVKRKRNGNVKGKAAQKREGEGPIFKLFFVSSLTSHSRQARTCQESGTVPDKKAKRGETSS